jgi:hypothetical protein
VPLGPPTDVEVAGGAASSSSPPHPASDNAAIQIRAASERTAPFWRVTYTIRLHPEAALTGSHRG